MVFLLLSFFYALISKIYLRDLIILAFFYFIYVYVEYILNHRNSTKTLENDKILVFCIS